MKMTDWLWGGLGVLGIVIGGVEIAQGKVLLALSAIVIGGLLIASSAVKLAKKN